VHFTNALQKIARTVLLVDEYDAPIIKNFGNRAVAIQIRDHISDFFVGAKAVSGELKCTLLTGTFNISLCSIFSGPNHLYNNSMRPELAGVCGYTDNEIRLYFADYLTECAAVNKMTVDEVMEAMARWYGGYCLAYHSKEEVYNPSSVLLYLQNQQLKNYWFNKESAPAYLRDCLKSSANELFGTPITSYEQPQAYYNEWPFSLDSQSRDGSYSLPGTVAVLFRRGYLAFALGIRDGDNFCVKFPNQEVRESLKELGVL